MAVIDLSSPGAGQSCSVGEFLNIVGEIKSDLQVKYRIEVQNAAGTVLNTLKAETVLADCPVIINDSFSMTQQMLENSIVITATDSAGGVNTKKISFKDFYKAINIDTSAIDFVAGEKIKVTAKNAEGETAEYTIDPVIAQPIISNPIVSLETIHAEDVTATATITPEKGQVKYTFKLGDTIIEETEFGDSFSLNKIIDNLDFEVGENILTINAEVTSGSITNWTAIVTKDDNLPTIDSPILDNLTVTATLNDLDGDSLSYRLLVNGVEKVSWTAWVVAPIELKKVFNMLDIDLTKDVVNTIRLEVKDSVGGEASWEGTVSLVEQNAIITINNAQISVPKNTAVQFGFSIKAPCYVNAITETVNAIDEGAVGEGTMYSIPIDRTQWAHIYSVEVSLVG